jgi:hypothetical protein
MPPLPQFPQLPQTAVSRSNSRYIGLATGVIGNLRRVGTLQPLRKFVLPEPPLSADFDRRNCLALCPQADRARGYPQPFGNRGCCQKWFTGGRHGIAPVYEERVLEMTWKGSQTDAHCAHGNLCWQAVISTVFSVSEILLQRV